MSSLILIFKFLVFIAAFIWFASGCVEIDNKLGSCKTIKENK